MVDLLYFFQNFAAKDWYYWLTYIHSSEAYAVPKINKSYFICCDMPQIDILNIQLLLEILARLDLTCFNSN